MEWTYVSYGHTSPWGHHIHTIYWSGFFGKRQLCLGAKKNTHTKSMWHDVCLFCTLMYVRVCVWLVFVRRTKSMNPSGKLKQCNANRFFLPTQNTIVSEKSVLLCADIHIHAGQIYRWFLWMFVFNSRFLFFLSLSIFSVKDYFIVRTEQRTQFFKSFPVLVLVSYLFLANSGNKLNENLKCVQWFGEKWAEFEGFVVWPFISTSMAFSLDACMWIFAHKWRKMHVHELR